MICRERFVKYFYARVFLMDESLRKIRHLINHYDEDPNSIDAVRKLMSEVSRGVSAPPAHRACTRAPARARALCLLHSTVIILHILRSCSALCGQHASFIEILHFTCSFFRLHVDMLDHMCMWLVCACSCIRGVFLHVHLFSSDLS